MPCNNTLPSVKEEHRAWMTKWKDPSDVERVFSPRNWGYTAQNQAKAYSANCPTLQEYDEIYGEGNAELWIYGQVTALFGSSSSKEKGVVDGIKIFVQSFFSQTRIYKLSELMLFFARYKSGRYDNSFSCFDARRIGSAFFKEFLPERAKEIDYLEKKRIEEETLLRRELPRNYIIPDGYNSYTWYKEIQKRALDGDSEALELLKNPNI